MVNNNTMMECNTQHSSILIQWLISNINHSQWSAKRMCRGGTLISILEIKVCIQVSLMLVNNLINKYLLPLLITCYNNNSNNQILFKHQLIPNYSNSLSLNCSNNNSSNNNNSPHSLHLVEINISLSHGILMNLI